MELEKYELEKKQRILDGMRTINVQTMSSNFYGSDNLNNVYTSN